MQPIPRKCWPIGVAFVLSALMASASALSAAPAAGEGGVPGNAVAALPNYMVLAANMDNAAYMACIKGKVSGPAEKNLLAQYQAALGCR